MPDTDPIEAGFDEAELENLRNACSGAVDSGLVPGAVVLLARRGHIGFFEGFGVMGQDNPAPMRTDAVFRIYSMTKPIATATALILHEQGRFAFDDPVAKWLPELEHLRLHDGSLLERPISVGDLICHTAGFTNLFANNPVAAQYRSQRIGSGDLDRLIEVLGSLPLLHQPGESFHYSLATDVLGKLIEIWTGQPLDKVLGALIFEPLGMEDTGFTVDAGVIENGRFTTNHMRRRDGTLTIADSAANSTYRRPPERLSGAAGLVSTAEDYLKFASMLLNGGKAESGQRLLQPATAALMTTNCLHDSALPVGVLHPLPGMGFGHGLSVRIEEHPDTDPGAIVGECGWGGAAGTHFWIAPHQELIAITMRQTLPYDTKFESLVKPVIYRAVRSVS